MEGLSEMARLEQFFIALDEYSGICKLVWR